MFNTYQFLFKYSYFRLFIIYLYIFVNLDINKIKTNIWQGKFLIIISEILF